MSGKVEFRAISNNVIENSTEDIVPHAPKAKKYVAKKVSLLGKTKNVDITDKINEIKVIEKNRYALTEIKNRSCIPFIKLASIHRDATQYKQKESALKIKTTGEVVIVTIMYNNRINILQIKASNR
jgi:hypothetical protein